MADGNDFDSFDPQFQKSIEEVKEDIRKEIRKELKLKEGAENLRKVIKNYVFSNWMPTLDFAEKVRFWGLVA